MKKSSLLLAFFCLAITASAQCWQKMACGTDHTVAIKQDGTLWTWGDNAQGQLGNGSDWKAKTTPQHVGSATDWKNIDAGGHFTIAQKTDGSLWAWGFNTSGQLGDSSYTNKGITVPLAKGAAWKNFSAGAAYVMAIKTDGTLWGWGTNLYSQLGDGTHTGKFQPQQTGVDTDWEKVVAGYYHTVAIKKNGTLWAWGLNYYGQLGDGNSVALENVPKQIGTATDWKFVDAGMEYTAALKTDGTLWTWGRNQNGQLGIGTTIDEHSPVQVGTDTNWQSISTGNTHMIAVKTDGTLWTWGSNAYGQLGIGTLMPQYSPVQIGVADNWSGLVNASDNITMALNTASELWAWGSNASGQLGIGTKTKSKIPASISCLATAMAEQSINGQTTVAWPNPATDHLYFSKEIITVDFYTSDGQKIDIPVGPAHAADISILPGGLYFLRATDKEGNSFSQSIIKLGN